MIDGKKKVFSDMKKFARDSKLKRVKDAHAPKQPMVHVSIATGTGPAPGSPFEGMDEESIEKLLTGKDADKKSEDEE
jgi:hypothetical protein